MLARLASGAECSTSAAAVASRSGVVPRELAARAVHTGSLLHASPTPVKWQSQQQPRQEALSADESGGGGDLQLTEAAVARLKQLRAESGGAAVLLRLVVDGGGCSGFQYQFSLEDQPPGEGDRLFSKDGVAVVSDDVSLEFLKGATVDFESDLMRSAFVVHDNPNAAASCGCGSSFAAK